MSEELEKAGEELAASGAESETGVAEASAASASNEDLIARLREENRQLSDQILRKQAEFDNIRKRLNREKEEFLQYSLFSTLETLLPVLDGFALAVQSPGDGQNYRKGVELIYQQYLSTLQRLGIEPIVTKDQFFDPNLHEAVAAVETDQFEDQQIVEEVQSGYMYKQRLLRPARVKVARRPSDSVSSTISRGGASVDDSGDVTILKLD